MTTFHVPPVWHLDCKPRKCIQEDRDMVGCRLLDIAYLEHRKLVDSSQWLAEKQAFKGSRIAVIDPVLFVYVN